MPKSVDWPISYSFLQSIVRRLRPPTIAKFGSGEIDMSAVEGRTSFGKNAIVPCQSGSIGGVSSLASGLQL